MKKIVNYKSTFSLCMLILIMVSINRWAWGQVVGNSISQGIGVGRSAGRPSDTLSSFRRFSKGVDSFHSLPRTTPNPLSYRMNGTNVSPQAGLTDRFNASGISNPLRPQPVSSPLHPVSVSQLQNPLLTVPLSQNINYNAGGNINNVPYSNTIQSSSNPFYQKMMSSSSLLPGLGGSGSLFTTGFPIRQPNLLSSSPFNQQQGLTSMGSVLFQGRSLDKDPLNQQRGLMSGNSKLFQRQSLLGTGGSLTGRSSVFIRSQSALIRSGLSR